MIYGRYAGLRAIERSDLHQLLQWRNQTQLRRYFREHRELSSEQQLLWYEKAVLAADKTKMFAIVDIEHEELLGACGLCHIDWINRNADFSIYIGAGHKYIDDKYAPDAARQMIKYAFAELNLHRLWAEIYDFDEAKNNLFLGLGFQLEGRHRQTHWSEGAWADSLFYALLASDAMAQAK